MNERFIISEDNNSLPINIRGPSFAISNNFKKFMVINTVIFPTTGWCLAQDSNGLIKRCILMYKYATYSSDYRITLNLEGLYKTNKAKTEWLHSAVHREHIADLLVSVQCQVVFFRRIAWRYAAKSAKSAQNSYNSCRNQRKLAMIWNWLGQPSIKLL